jgi:hypothetical protein
VLAELAKDAGSYLEVGVQDGDSVAAVVRANPGIALTMCDTWGPHHGGTDRKTHTFVEKRLNALNHEGSRTYLDGDSTVMIPQLTEWYDLVHVDGDHSFEGCKADLKNCWPITYRWLVIHDVFFLEVRNAVFQFLEWHVRDFQSIRLSASDHGTMVIERTLPKFDSTVLEDR